MEISEREILILIGIVILLLVIYYSLTWRSKMIRANEARFKDRKDLSPKEFYSLFYADSSLPEEKIKEVVQGVASELNMPVGKLRPGDRFDDKLGSAKGWEYEHGEGMVSINLSLPNFSKRAKEQIDPTKIETLDDYIRCMVTLL